MGIRYQQYGFTGPQIKRDLSERDELAETKRANDFWVKKIAGHVMSAEYFGYPWRMESDIKQGIFKIQLTPVMKNNWYLLHFTELVSDPGLRQVDKACGELLERFQVPRVYQNRDEWRAAMASIKWFDRISNKGFVPT